MSIRRERRVDADGVQHAERLAAVAELLIHLQLVRHRHAHEERADIGAELIGQVAIDAVASRLNALRCWKL